MDAFRQKLADRKQERELRDARKKFYAFLSKADKQRMDERLAQQQRMRDKARIDAAVNIVRSHNAVMTSMVLGAGRIKA